MAVSWDALWYLSGCLSLWWYLDIFFDTCLGACLSYFSRFLSIILVYHICLGACLSFLSRCLSSWWSLVAFLLFGLAATPIQRREYWTANTGFFICLSKPGISNWPLETSKFSSFNCNSFWDKKMFFSSLFQNGPATLQGSQFPSLYCLWIYDIQQEAVLQNV